jgi:FemAB-related protein (PEP-CTERM system-associated)
LWDHYVSARPEASHYHQFAWRDVIHGTYGHGTYYLMATRGERGTILGILPLVHLKSRIFGSGLVSLPFADSAGILAESSDVAERLLAAAVALARRVGADCIDLRCERQSAVCEAAVGAAKRSGKVRMLRSLPGSSAELVKSFKSKLRSQINRPLKEGCACRVGGLELLEDFYRVFLVNMRDLGSPVHSKELMRRVLEAFPERSRIFVVHRSGEPIAASLVIGFHETLRNPWACSDRRYAAMSPNMLLYSRMLEFACDEGYRTFDFGRSTPGEGTYRFKEQWGALAAPLHWYVLSTNGTPSEPLESPAERFKLAARLWSKLPLAVTRVLGPRIRKHISL